MAHKKTIFCLWPYALIGGLVILAYLPTLWGEFILDDHPLIKSNPYVRALQSPVSYLTQEDGITDKSDTGDYHTGYYRPLINLSYSVDYKLWGMNPSGFRATNLLLHILCCLVLFYFVELLVNDRQGALWVTLIFALHPANTESVSWIGSRDNILVAIFSLSSLIFYIRGCKDGNRLKQAASVLAFVLAILSKELGLMMIPIFFLYQRILSGKDRNGPGEWVSYLPFVMVMIAYLFLRKLITTAYLSPSQMADVWQRIFFATYLILWDLRLILLPYALHSFVVGYPSTYLGWEFLAGLCYTGILGILMWKQRKNDTVLFSVLSFHVVLFPILNIIPTSAISLVSMRWIYFPMTFLSPAGAQLIKGLLREKRFVTRAVLCSVIVYLGGYSYVLNSTLWNSEDNFFRQEVLNFGNYYYAGGLAENLQDKQEYEMAERYFYLAIRHYPLEAINYINFSALLTDTGRPDMALDYLQKARALRMTRKRRGEWFNNMGVAYFQLGNYHEAVKDLVEAVRYCPGQVQYLTNLGGSYTAMGDYEKAIAVLKRGLDIDSDAVPLRKNLAMTYIRMERYKDALNTLEKIPQGKWKRHGLKGLLKEARQGLALKKTDANGPPETRQP